MHARTRSISPPDVNAVPGLDYRSSPASSFGSRGSSVSPQRRPTHTPMSSIGSIKQFSLSRTNSCDVLVAMPEEPEVSLAHLRYQEMYNAKAQQGAMVYDASQHAYVQQYKMPQTAEDKPVAKKAKTGNAAGGFMGRLYGAVYGLGHQQHQVQQTQVRA